MWKSLVFFVNTTKHTLKFRLIQLIIVKNTNLWISEMYSELQIDDGSSQTTIRKPFIGQKYRY